MNRTTTVLVLSTAVLALAACGSDTATQDAVGPDGTELPAPDDLVQEVANDAIVFEWAETGGCAMAGPNCARYVVSANGSVSTYREGSEELAARGDIDAAIVAAWVAAVAGADMDAVADRAGPGEMTAAFDGVDSVLSAPHLDVSVSSVDVAFAATEPVFATAQAVYEAAAAAAPLELESR